MSGALIGKGNHRHFMEKEIFEQASVLGDTLRSFADPATHRIGAAGAAVRPRRPCRGLPRSPAAPLPMPAWSASTGSRAGGPAGGLGHRQRVPLPRRAAGPGPGRAVRLPVGRDRRHAGRDAPSAGSRAQGAGRGQRAREHASRARPTRCCARSPDRRSGSPRPRRSPRSWRPWPALPSARPGRAGG